VAPDADKSSVSPDEVDDALETLWKGRSKAFERLLERSGSGDPAFGELFGGLVAKGLPDPAKETAPTVAGYTIVGELGRGGMGVIYEAQQHHPPRLVALKVIRSGLLPHGQQVKLFEREIQSLARLKHPNIAAIHDAGMTDDDRPYFAMELVRGQTLVEFVRTLPADGRGSSEKIGLVLRLFECICDAISYAHQRGVIHRDLKPSNILVTDKEEGSGSGSSANPGARIKVLDFGLARLTDADIEITTSADAGQIRGTLAYMAPEQIQGDPADIDTRSDVYAMGVLLFELLTGRLPYDIKHSSMGRVIRTICDTPPTRPSALSPALRGDLETILLMALAKDRGHRYQSAVALGEDIGRFLANQPILARPQSAIYQLRKLIARHRVASLSVFTTVLVAVVGFLVSATLYVRADAALQAEAAQRAIAEKERAMAQKQEAVAEEVSAFLTNMLLSLDPRNAEGKDITVLGELADQASQRIRTELAGQPDVQAAMENTLGKVYLELGRYDDADTHLTTALESLRELYGDDHPGALTAAHLLGRLRQDQGRLDDAKALFTSTLEKQRRVLGEDHRDTLTSLNSLGVLYVEQHELADAERLLREAVARRQQTLGESDPDTLISLNNLSNAVSLQGKYAEAEAMLRELLVGQQAVLPEGHLDILVSQNDLAVALKEQGKLDEAESLYRQVLAGFQRVLGGGHMDTLITMNNLANLLSSRKAYEAAGALYKDLVETAETALPPGSYYTAVFRGGYGNTLVSLGEKDEAERQLVKSAHSLRQSLGPNHTYTRMYTDALFTFYEKTDQSEKAEALRKKWAEEDADDPISPESAD